MKIHICTKLKDEAWGGGNQFLKMLRLGFKQNGVYTDSIKEADIILFDSYQNFFKLIKYKFIYPQKKIIYRLGPIFSMHRKEFKWKLVDKMVIFIANLFVDLVIFQSEWSYEQALKLGFIKNKKYNIILNAVDDSIFYKKQYIQKDIEEPIKLVYTSWSSNMNKGFSYLKFLDNNLDFKKYSMKFIGNSPIIFKNIEILKPLPSKELADELRASDIFISPTKDDACSNALLEGLACGLPAIALLSGGNKEIIKEAGELFQNEKELIDCINKVSNDVFTYYNLISLKNSENVCSDYISAISKIC